MPYIWPVPQIDYRRLGDIEETRPVALVTSRVAWNTVKDKLHLNVVWQGEAEQADESYWTALGADLRGDVIYAVGGGLAVDTAKYLAIQHRRPLVCLPTALSVDAFLTWASGVRRDGCVYYIETRPPDSVIVDLDVIAAAPASIRAAGICDVLSIATGCWDWRFAEEGGQNSPDMRLIPYIEQVALGILQGALDCAEAAGRGEHGGLKQLLDCLALEVQLCNQIRHSRPEEGSEHYFAYSVENIIGKGLPHGDLVGPGIIVIAALQGQDTAPLLKALKDCGILLDRIPGRAIRQTLETLPTYVRKHKLPYGIAHELDRRDLSHLPLAD